MQFYGVRFGVLLLAVAGGSSSVEESPRGDAPPLLNVKLKKNGDSIIAKVEKGKTILAITSLSGISSATVERVDEKWPKTVVFRLHLKGLENFKASNGNLTLNAVATIKNGKLDLRQWKDKQENPGLDKSSPLWMGVQVMEGAEPAKEIPLKNGYFELTLPAAFLEGNPKSITLDWIDFYR